MFTIIKDCSPYYITFTYEGLPEYIKLLQSIANKSEFVVSNNKSVTAIQEIVPSYQTKEFYVKDEKDLSLVIDNNPVKRLLNLDKSAAFLTTLPGVKSPIHLDINGATNKPVQFRINYPIFVHDTNCITSWYSSDGIVPHEKISYIADPTLSTPNRLESLCFSQEYAILFNTTIYHDWDNTTSTNDRTIIGMKADKNQHNTTYEDARKILFGI